MTGGKKPSLAVIMAGGIGERFWPMTGPSNPKYALKIDGKRTFLSATYGRLLGLYPPHSIYVVTAAQHANLVQKLLPRMARKNILAEPERRNTAGAVTYATLQLKQIYGKDAVLSFFPADARIKDENGFRAVARKCAGYAASHDEIVVMGIRPSFPSTGYGYIECGRARPSPWSGFCRVARFREKPDLATAKRFLATRRFLWNAGIFTWKISVFERAMRDHAASYYAPFLKAFSQKTVSASALRSVFRKIPVTPIDRLLIEKTSNLAVIKAGFDWDDVGTWEALRRTEAAGGGNVITAGGVFEDVTGSVVACDPGFRIVACGLRNVIIAQSGKNILVCDIARSQDVTRLKREAEGKKPR